MGGYETDGEQLFSTPTLARLYVAQGKLDHARDVYVELLREHPEATELREGLRQVEARIAAERALLTPQGSRVALQESGAHIDCRWTVSEVGVRQARLLLEDEGSLTLRRVSFPTDPGLSVEDIPLDETEGALQLKKPAGALLVAAAVGLLHSAGGRFVSIAHADGIPLG